ncbi:MAG: DUF1570 domain-containing protein [Planctomycetes bacterium]|nr:DUF1570 domain-containing protein [Planctomycetota bacterium]
MANGNHYKTPIRLIDHCIPDYCAVWRWVAITAVVIALGSASVWGQQNQSASNPNSYQKLSITKHVNDAKSDQAMDIADLLTVSSRDVLKIQTRLNPPLDSDSYSLARSLLPQRFTEYHTARWVVLSDASAVWTRRQSQLLERARHQFLRFTRRVGLQPKPLRHKLVCILFDSRDEYHDFAQKQDGVTAQWISGYYSPKHDRVVFYNVSDSTPRKNALSQASSTATNLPRDDADQRATATTIHEAIHQLMFHTGVQSAHIEYPLWICEGLATAFETDVANGAFGPDHEYAPRRNRFKQLVEDQQLIDLRKLVTFARMPDDRDETVQAVYHQSYALVTWMTRYRTDELHNYLQSMLDEPAGRPTPERQLEIFEQAFGDVDQVQRAWLRAEKRK